MRLLAPLWRYYVLKIKHRLEFTTPGNQEFAAKYAKLDVNWVSKMHNWNSLSLIPSFQGFGNVWVQYGRGTFRYCTRDCS